MTKKPAYKFIQYPYECSLGSSPDVLIEHTILDKDCSLSDLLGVMEGFLKASGHHFSGRLDIVDESPVPYRADAGLVSKDDRQTGGTI